MLCITFSHFSEYAIENENEDFVRDATNTRADVNDDGQINVVDITALIDIIMNS